MVLKKNHYAEYQLKMSERECGKTSCSDLEESRRNYSTRLREGKDKKGKVFSMHALDEIQEILNDLTKKNLIDFIEESWLINSPSAMIARKVINFKR